MNEPFDPRKQQQQQGGKDITPAKQEIVPPAQEVVPPVKAKNIEIKDVKDAPAHGLSFDEAALATKEKLSKQPKHMFMIPLENGEQKGTYRSVIINGYRCEIKKGVMVSLPESIFKVLVEAYSAEVDATQGNEYNLNSAEPAKRSALGVA